MAKSADKEKKQPTWCQQLDKQKARVKNPNLPKSVQKPDSQPEPK